jgi:hypothetical protein
VIILDTNQLETLRPPSGPILRILAEIAKAIGGELALPEMVFIEHIAHKSNRMKEAADNYNKSGKLLTVELEYARNKKSQRRRFGEVSLDHDDLMRQYREALARVVPQVLPTPDRASREALIREAWRKAPAYTRWDSGPGKGGRDVAIWLTVLDFAAKNPGKTVHFISEDKAAFGGSSGLNVDLRQEIEEWPGGALTNLRYHATVSDFLAETAADPVAAPTAEYVGSSSVVAESVWKAVQESDASSALSDAAFSVIPRPAGRGMVSTSSTEEFKLDGLDRLEKASSYSMGGIGWANFTATWNIRGEYSIDAKSSDDQLFLGTVSAWGPFRSVVVCELDDKGDILSAEVTEVRVFRGASLSVSTGD